MSPTRDTRLRLTPGAQRILAVASDLFYNHGIHAIGVDTIAAESGITKRTLYNQFGSKDTLVTAYLQQRDDKWWAQIEQRIDESEPPRTLVLIDAYVDHSTEIDRGCAFINAAAELPADHPGYDVIRKHKQAVRRRLAELLASDGIDDADATAEHLFLLIEAAVAHRGIDGNDQRLQHAERLARQLIQQP